MDKRRQTPTNSVASVTALMLVLLSGALMTSAVGTQGEVKPLNDIGPGETPIIDQANGAEIPLANNEWTRMNPASLPFARQGMAMVYDAKVDRAVVFGGAAYKMWMDDTWAFDYDNNSWKEMRPSVHPTARGLAGMVYDSWSDRLILFGGSRGGALLNDTWTYDFNNNTWKEMKPASSPSPRQQHEMIYDPIEDRIVLFGGNGSSPLNDTWAYDYNTNAWSKMKPPASPSARHSMGFVYDLKAQRAILYGGRDKTTIFDDTWSYDHKNDIWRKMDPWRYPSARFGIKIVYNSMVGMGMVFSGRTGSSNYSNEVWAYDHSSNNWTNMNVFNTYKLENYGMGYDLQSDKTIIYGGLSAGGVMHAVFIYNYGLNNVVQLFPPNTPSERWGMGMAYDSVIDRTILFGGYSNGVYFDDTWAYNYGANKWTKMNPSTTPSPRVGVGMTYDSTNDRVILFGGFKDTTAYNDTWAYDYRNDIWTLLVPKTKPIPRQGHSMVYDYWYGRVILFGGHLWGGYNATEVGNDTWAYDYQNNEWTLMKSKVRPTGRSGPGMAYDPKFDRVVLYGGEGQFVWQMNDTWIYDYGNDTWTMLNLSIHPPGVSGSPMVYDSQSERTIQFGGRTGISTYGNETWTFDHATLSWENMSAKASPPASHNFGMVYDSKNDRTIMFGGSTPYYNNLDEIWTYDLYKKGDIVPPSVVNTAPANGTSGVPLDATISILWNEGMNRSSTESAFNADPAITCAWSWNDSKQTCTPTNQFAFGTKYNISISTSARDIAGNQISNPYAFSFITIFKQPIVLSTDPANGSIDVLLNATITITFSRPMNASATEGAISSNRLIGWNSVWADNQTKLTLKPSRQLDPGVIYAINISTVAKSTDGLYLLNNYSLSFTTVPLSVVPPPAVQPSLDPAVVVVIIVVVAATILFFLTFEWVMYAVGLLLLPLYMKLKKENILDNFLRGQIYEFIRQHPGAHLRLIKSELNIEMGGLYHHLDKLQKVGMIRSENTMILKKFYVNPSEKKKDKPLLTDVQQRMLTDLKLRPGQRAIMLSRNMDISHRSAMYNLRRLEEIGLVATESSSRGIKYHINEKKTMEGEGPKAD